MNKKNLGTGWWLIAASPKPIREAVAQATALAEKLHAGQVRPGGEPQIEHAVRVAEKALAFGGFIEELSHEDLRVLVCSAVLHDVLEDTPCTDEDLAAQFGAEVVRIVRAVSHDAEEESDELYLGRVAAGGRLAVLVKRCDRLDNLQSLSRAPQKFREVKLAEVEAALPIWRRIDSQGATLIESLLASLRSSDPSDLL